MLAVLVLSLMVTVQSPSRAQFSLPQGLGSPGGINPPSEVTRLGSIEVAPVHSPITGNVLFRLASPTVYNRDAESADLTAAVERRAEEVNARLQRATWHRQDPLMDLDTLEVNLGQLNNVTVITVKDDHYTQPLILVSVTQTDANYHGLPIPELGEEWRSILEGELRSGIRQLSPNQVTRDVMRAALILGVLVGLTIAGILAKYFIRRYQQRLRLRKQALNEANPTDEVSQEASIRGSRFDPAEQIVQQRNRFLLSLEEIWSLDRRLNFLSWMQWLLFWLLVLLWYGGIYYLFIQLPFLGQFSSGIVSIPIQLLGIWFFAGLAIRLSRRLIDRFTTEREGFDLGDILTFGDAQRRQLRASTIARAAKGLVSVLIVSISILLGLRALGLPTGSVVAIGGIFGLAISFGSQNLVKDLVNGFLILAEDQFAIGDVVDLGSAAGLVESLNLRVTQLRSADGELVTLPNSSISQVKNLTRSWSRVNFSIDVAYQTDPQQALTVLQDVAQQFYDDPEWQDKMLAVPDVLGIDGVSHTGMTITIWIQTAPAQQWSVGREFRLRVRQALADNGIEIGTPRQTYALEAVASNGNGQLPPSAAMEQSNP